MADPFDLFLEELAQRERQKILGSDGLLFDGDFSFGEDDPLTDLIDPMSPERIWRHTNHFSEKFSRKQIKKACRRHPSLVVVKMYGIVLIGTPDRSGHFIYPNSSMPIEGLPFFIQEVWGQWVAIPKQGYNVSWQPRPWNMDTIELYPLLDGIADDLQYHPSRSLFNLHQLIIEALGLSILTIPYTEA